MEIKNNILYKNKFNGVSSWDAHGNGIVFSHNLFYSNPHGDINFTSGHSNYIYIEEEKISGMDPLFVNESSDFHLTGNSPAVDSGFPLPEVNTDFDNNKRPQLKNWNIGAFEFSRP